MHDVLQVTREHQARRRMAIEHQTLRFRGVHFHPESLMSSAVSGAAYRRERFPARVPTT